MMRHAIILAGGVGARFWPYSTEKEPKQCLKLFSKKTLLEETIARMKRIVPEKNIIISTGQSMLDKLGNCGNARTIAEPYRRNTAAAIGLSAMKIYQEDKEAIIAFETSDHSYLNKKEFTDVMRCAMKLAESDRFITLGIKPKYPETGYGYIKKGKKAEQSKKESCKKHDLYKVDRFIEKPDLKKAKHFLKKGYFWNSGIFIFKAETFFKQLETTHPKLKRSLEKIAENNFTDKIIEKEFKKMENISIDKAFCERTDDIYVIPCDPGWSDIGSWKSISDMKKKDSQGNYLEANTLSIDSKNCSIFSKSNKKIGLVGVEDLIIVEKDDAILICSKKDVQKVKELGKKFC